MLGRLRSGVLDLTEVLRFPNEPLLDAGSLRWNAEHGMPEEMTRLVAARDSYDYYAGHLDSSAEHTSYLTGELVDDFAIAGPVDKCLAKIEELAELGVDEVSAAYLNGRFEQMELVGTSLLGAAA